MANQKCVYGKVWDIAILTSCRIVRENCHSMVAGTLYYRYRHLLVLRSQGYWVHKAFIPHHGKLGMRFWGHYSLNCPVLRADGPFYGSQDHVPSVPPVMDLSVQGLFVELFYPHTWESEMRIWSCLWCRCSHKLPRRLCGWSYYQSQDTVLPVTPVTGPRV